MNKLVDSDIEEIMFGNDYTYDVNGNMKKDLNKDITNINYNHLLPTQVTISGQNIDYIYDASGTKIRKTVNGTTTDYTGNYVYENGDLKFFNHTEGYVNVGLSLLKVIPKPYTFSYVYQYKDHLGNVRLSYADSDGNGEISASAEIIEENNYYPFGLKHKGYNFAAFKDSDGKLNPMFILNSNTRDTTVSKGRGAVNALKQSIKQNEELQKQKDSIITANN